MHYDIKSTNIKWYEYKIHQISLTFHHYYVGSKGKTVGSLSLLMQFGNMRMRCIYCLIQCFHWCHNCCNHSSMVWKYSWRHFYRTSSSKKYGYTRIWLIIPYDSIMVQCTNFWVYTPLQVDISLYNSNYSFMIIICICIKKFVIFCEVSWKIWMIEFNSIYYSYFLDNVMWEISHSFVVNYFMLRCWR
jgi:hypothetical protein